MSHKPAAVSDMSSGAEIRQCMEPDDNVTVHGAGMAEQQSVTGHGAGMAEQQSVTGHGDHGAEVAEHQWDDAVIMEQYEHGDVITEQCDDSDVITEQCEDGEVITEQCEDGEVITEQCEDGEVITEQCEDGDVITEQCDDGEVVTEQCDDGEVVTEQCDDSEVVTEQCDDGEVITEQCEDGEVITEQCDDGEVITEQCEGGEVVTEHCGDVLLSGCIFDGVICFVCGRVTSDPVSLLLSKAEGGSGDSLAVRLVSLLTDESLVRMNSADCVCAGCKHLLKQADQLHCKLQEVQRELQGRRPLQQRHSTASPPPRPLTPHVAKWTTTNIEISSLERCSSCQLNFAGRAEYLRHMLSRHPSQDIDAPADPQSAVETEPPQLVQFHSADSLKEKLQTVSVGSAAPISQYRRVTKEDLKRISHLVTRVDHVSLMAKAPSRRCRLCCQLLARLEDMSDHRCRAPQLGRSSFVCRGCDQRFHNWAQLRTHKLQCRLPPVSHRSGECPLCGKHVKRLEAHLQRHRASGGLKKQSVRCLDGTRAARSMAGGTCSICSKYIAYRLRRHEESHQRTACPICNKKLSRSDVVENHIRRVHAKETNYTCGQCGRTLGSLYSLQRHQLIHNNTYRYYCQQCGAGFRQKPQLTAHMRRKHGITDIEYEEVRSVVPALAADGHPQDLGIRFLCQQCGCGFPSRRQLGSHMKREHGARSVVYEGVQISSLEPATRSLLMGSSADAPLYVSAPHTAPDPYGQDPQPVGSAVYVTGSSDMYVTEVGTGIYVPESVYGSASTHHGPTETVQYTTVPNADWW